MASLLDLLHQTPIQSRILSDLGWNDLLRLRRACKGTRDVTTRYMRIHPELAPELEINEEDKSLSKFMEMNIPTTKVFLNNATGYKFFDSYWVEISRFLEEYASLVKYLRVKVLSMHLHGKEWDFLDGLVNLESYQAETMGVGEQVTSLESVEGIDRIAQQLLKLARKDLRFAKRLQPDIFGKVKVLKIGGGTELGSSFVIGNMINRFSDLLQHCLQVEHLAYPFSSKLIDNALLHNSNNVLGPTFAAIQAHIIIRLMAHPEGPGLKSFDFCGFHQDPNLPVNVFNGSESFLQLCVTCHQNNVKLLNVAANWFEHRLDLQARPELTAPELGEVVVSLVNPRMEVLTLDMPNLERIEVRDTSRCELGWEPEQDRPEWPALKSLDINLYKGSTLLGFNMERPDSVPTPIYRSVQVLFNFFFRDIQRLSLVELRLNFAGQPEDMEAPSTEDIANACPNLKKLTIIGWPGTNQELAKLWGSLPALEEVCLEHCQGLRNEAFIGEDPDKPLFLELKRLKKLCLRGLDEMPGISNAVFSQVLCHMNLTHFTLSSSQPIETITGSGVESLLDGPFAQSIVKFRFCGWSLTGLTEEEWQGLAQKFQSFSML